jgi:hypothetical protein
MQNNAVFLPLSQAKKTYGLFLKNAPDAGSFLYAPPKCKAALHLSEPLEFLEVVVANGAELKIICNQPVAEIRIKALASSTCKVVGFGSTKIRAELVEENANVELFGLIQSEASVQSEVRHLAPHTKSRQHFKSVLRGKMKSSFEGKIYVAPIAQKTEAYQLSNALLLSDDATHRAMPNLEIFADDVKASHGATTGQIDEESLFYLRSRGLSEIEAKELLVEGFCKEILDHAR